MKAGYDFGAAPAYPGNHWDMDMYIASSLKTCLLEEEVYSSQQPPHITFHTFDMKTRTTRSFYRLPAYSKVLSYD